MGEASEAAEVFTVLYRAQYRPLVGYFLRRVDDLELAQDLAAETFRIAWTRRAEGLRGRAWLFAVARNLIGDEYRRRARDRGRTEELGRAAGDADGEDARIEVQDVLARLPDAQREILSLTYWEGLSAREIAVVLDIGVSAVWMRQSRARSAFAETWRAAEHSVPLPPATRTRSSS